MNLMIDYVTADHAREKAEEFDHEQDIRDRAARIRRLIDVRVMACAENGKSSARFADGEALDLGVSRQDMAFPVAFIVLHGLLRDRFEVKFHGELRDGWDGSGGVFGSGYAGALIRWGADDSKTDREAMSAASERVLESFAGEEHVAMVKQLMGADE